MDFLLIIDENNLNRGVWAKKLSNFGLEFVDLGVDFFGDEHGLNCIKIFFGKLKKNSFKLYGISTVFLNLSEWVMQKN